MKRIKLERWEVSGSTTLCRYESYHSVMVSAA